MDVIRDLHWSPAFASGSVATVGEFDGVHRGHQVVLLELIRTAVVEGCPSVVVTFDDGDAISSQTVPPQLMHMSQKLELLHALGVDVAVVLPWQRVVPDGEALARDPVIEWMVDEVFTARLKAKAVVVGEDFNFGPRRRLGLDTFMDRSSSANFRVVRIPVESRITATGDIISARSIREALSRGDVRTAARMLGRPHEIRAAVANGDRRGRSIGFPTANLPTPSNVQVPADGVYACWYQRSDGSRHRAAVNIGRRPTFLDFAEHSLIEAHLLEFSGDLYADAARLQFVERVRDETKFDGIEALRAQLHRDVKVVKTMLPA